MIHICYGIQDKSGRYSKFAGTSITSIFENTKSQVTIHILHDNTLNDKNRNKFKQLVENYNQKIEFYNLEENAMNDIEKFKNIFREGTFPGYSLGIIYRLLIPKVISQEIEKIIYMDSDTIINLDISELWNVSIEDCPLAAVPESANGENYISDKTLALKGYVPKENYFNSGVLYINLKYWRENEEILINGGEFLKQNPQLADYPDQDLLNYCFAAKIKILPVTFNSFVNAERQYKNPIDQKIYHYTASSLEKGLKMNTSDIYHRLYFNYFVKSTWCTAEVFGNIEKFVRNMYIDRQRLMIHMINLLSQKKRAFFTEVRYADAIKQIFSIRDSEEVIYSTKPKQIGVDNLIKAMKKSKGKKVFIIFADIYVDICDLLIQNNFVENVDFINGVGFLSEKEGIPFKSYPLIKAM